MAEPGTAQLVLHTGLYLWTTRRYPSFRRQNACMPRPRPLPSPLLGQPFTIKEAKAAGLTRRRARAKDLASPCHGVRIPASADLTLLVRARSLALATGAVASHLTAAALWGFPLPRCFETHEVVHLTCRRGGRAVRRKDVRGHQSVLLPEEIIEGRYVACTSPLRTWFDLAGVLGLQDLVIAGDFLLRRRNPLSTLTALDAFLATKEGRPGYRKAMKARAPIRSDTDFAQGNRAAPAAGRGRPARTIHQPAVAR